MTTPDARESRAHQQRRLILGSFDDLSPGDALLVVDDRGPKPFFFQFQEESRGPGHIRSTSNTRSN